MHDKNICGKIALNPLWDLSDEVECQASSSEQQQQQQQHVFHRSIQKQEPFHGSDVSAWAFVAQFCDTLKFSQWTKKKKPF